MRLALLALFLTTALVVSGSEDLYVAADQKLDRIANDEAAPGSVTQLSTAEVNALVRGKLKEEGVEGVSNPKVVLGEDSGSWSGLVDFGKLPQLESLRSNFLLASLLKDAKPVTAAITLVSSGGEATVDAQYVTIGETKFEGRTLGFLVEKLVLSDFPDATLGEPFELEHNVESIKLRSSGITIKIKD